MFRDRQIRRLGLARWISMTGAEAAFFVGLWGRAAFELDATPGRLALLMAVMALAGLAGAAAGGLLVDRYGPRTVLLAGEFAVVPATLALTVPETLGQLTWTVALASAAAMIVYSAVAAFPALLTREPDRLARANAAVELASTAAFVAGPAGGAALAATGGLDAVFIADAATSLIAALLCLGLRTDRDLDREAVGRAGRMRWVEMTAGVRFAYQRPRLRFLLSVGMLTWLSFGAFGALEPLYFREVLRADPVTLGWVNSVFGLGLATGALLLDRAPSRFATLPRATALAAAGGLGAVLYTGTTTLPVVVAAAVVWGAVLGVLLPTLRTLVQAETPADLVGRMMGVVQVHERAADLVPLIVAPGLAAIAGVQAVLVGTGALVAVLGVALLTPAARLEQRERTTAAEPLPASVR